MGRVADDLDANGADWRTVERALLAAGILAWNADGTNLPAALHGQFMEIFASNSLCRPGAMTVLGSPIDLSRIGTLASAWGRRFRGVISRPPQPRTHQI